MDLIIDVDGVIADHYSKWHAAYNNDYSDSLTPERIRSWDTHKYVKPECGHKIYEYINVPGFFRDLPEIPGAIDALKLLKDMGHHIELCTASPRNGFCDKYDWLSEHISFLNMDKNLWFGAAKGSLQGDALIDDGPHNLTDFIERTHPAIFRVPFLVDHPHNRYLPASYRRVHSLEHFATIAYKAKDLTLESFLEAFEQDIAARYCQTLSGQRSEEIETA